MQCDQYLCKYCFTSCAIRRKRTTFKPDEPATAFVSLQREKRVDGLFPSSGIVPDAVNPRTWLNKTDNREPLLRRCVSASAADI